MAVTSTNLKISMTGGTGVENITKEVQRVLDGSGLLAGIVVVFIKHTTAGVLIIEDEPGIRSDTKTLWDKLVPENPAWQHNTRNPGEDNAHSHLRAQLQGSSVTIPFTAGRLALGTWQQIVVLDFDTRSRARDLIVQVIGE
jgi:secondary thiamine-phosphate synthase enzyme